MSFYPGNAGTSDPTHFAMIVLLETDHGRPLAVMDGRLMRCAPPPFPPL